MAHRIEQVSGAGPLDDLAGVHDHDTVGPGGNDAHVVGDEQDGHVEALAQLVDQVEDLGLDGHVQGCGGLVRDQQLRLAGQGHRNHYPLAQATGQLVRVLFEPLLGPGHAHEAEHFDGPVERLALGRAFVDAHGLGNLAANGPRGVQRCHRVLEDHPDVVAAHLAHLRLAQGDKVAAVKADLSARDMADIGQQLHHREPDRRFAATRLAHEAQALAHADRERDPVDGFHIYRAQVELRLEVVDLQDRRRRPGAGQARAGQARAGQARAGQASAGQASVALVVGLVRHSLRVPKVDGRVPP